MAYVRQRGSQLLIVHGARVPKSGKVEQQILFTIYSKAEALEILGKRRSQECSFEALLRHRYPDLSFNWKAIRRSIEQNLDVLPDLYEYRSDRLRGRFRQDLTAFARQLMLVDPQDLMPSAHLLEEHHHELQYLADLIQWRLKLRSQKEHQFNADNPFYWRFELQGRTVPDDTEEHAAGFYERGEYDRARAIFQLLVEAFDGYAEGYNYLGLIAYQLGQLDVAIGHFAKTVELGRKLFPRSLGKRSFWADHRTRPYMRGLGNLALSLNEAERFEEALKVCARIEAETGDVQRSSSHRADVFLNTRAWAQAAQAAVATGDVGAAFVEAFAQFELGMREAALRQFLRGALLAPRAARMLVSLRSPTKPRSRQEAEDHNTGVAMCRRQRPFLKAQSRASRSFFKGIMKDARVARLLAESEDVRQRWQSAQSPDDRGDFKRMTLMGTKEFAAAEASNLLDLVRAPSPSAVLH
jgi:tetratricopeptide (TPR) repeat protein